MDEVERARWTRRAEYTPEGERWYLLVWVASLPSRVTSKPWDVAASSCSGRSMTMPKLQDLQANKDGNLLATIQPTN